MALPPDPAPIVTAYIGLGGNLDQPAERIRAAISALSELDRARVVAVSSLYRSAPMGPQDQPHFVNAVLALDTSLPPLQLLDHLQTIETRFGRVRQRVWGPRTLDLDILLYGDWIIDEPRLIVPHPGVAEREFVLYPLAEIAPSLIIPGLGPLAERVAACPLRGMELMPDV